VRFDDEQASYQARKDSAFNYLTKLFAIPGKKLDVNTLRGQPASEPIPDRATTAGEEDASDEEAIVTEEAEMRRLALEIQEAGAANDTETAERLRQQFDALAEHVRGEKGPRGRKKKEKLGPKSPAERAHHAIAKSLRDLRERLRPKMPKLAAHLDDALKMESPHIGYFPSADAPTWAIKT
jgi:hypothetical protein